MTSSSGRHMPLPEKPYKCDYNRKVELCEVQRNRMSARFFSSRCEYRRRRACLNVDSTFEPRQTSVHACTATVVCTPGQARPGGRRTPARPRPLMAQPSHFTRARPRAPTREPSREPRMTLRRPDETRSQLDEASSQLDAASSQLEAASSQLDEVRSREAPPSRELPRPPDTR